MKNGVMLKMMILRRATYLCIDNPLKICLVDTIMMLLWLNSQLIVNLEIQV